MIPLQLINSMLLQVTMIVSCQALVFNRGHDTKRLDDAALNALAVEHHAYALLGRTRDSDAISQLDSVVVSGTPVITGESNVTPWRRKKRSDGT